MKQYNKLSVVFNHQNGSYFSFSLTLCVDTTLWYVVEFWEGWLSVVSGTKLTMLTATWWNVKYPRLWIFSEVLIRIVTLSVHTSVSSLCGLFWSVDITGGDFEALLLNNWTCTESHGHSVCCNARCRLCVPCVFYTQAFVYSQVCCEVCLCVFPGCVLLHICAGWVMGIPCLHSPAQHASDCSVGWTPSRLHIKTLCLFHMEQLRPATRSLFHLTALGWVFFFSHCSYCYLSFWQQGCFAWECSHMCL